MRRWMLIVSMLLCRVALADDGVEPPWKLLASVKPVSMEVVDQVVEANDRAVQACNRNSRRLDTLAVLMTLSIDADGKVTGVEAVPQDQDNGKAPAEAACLSRVVKKLKFPAAGIASKLAYPFMLVSRVRREPAF
jgi:hypothetical protein